MHERAGVTPTSSHGLRLPACGIAVRLSQTANGSWGPRQRMRAERVCEIDDPVYAEARLSQTGSCCLALDCRRWRAKTSGGASDAARARVGVGPGSRSPPRGPGRYSGRASGDRPNGQPAVRGRNDARASKVEPLDFRLRALNSASEAGPARALTIVGRLGTRATPGEFCYTSRPAGGRRKSRKPLNG